MTETHAQAPRTYPPSEEFAQQANATADLYAAAEADRSAFWAQQANRLTWQTPFTEVLDWSGAPVAKWFVGGTLNVAYNCVDRHVGAGHGDRIAIYWEGEPLGDSRTITYSELLTEVCKAANALAGLGLKTGDRVVESALVGHSHGAEAAVVGASDDSTGQAIYAFVILESSAADKPHEHMVEELRAEVAREISPIAKPKEIHIVPELPKTRSGKIMRRLLRDVAEGRELGDTSTLLDPGVFEAIRASKAEA